ncbi:type II toxin-antitoxin system PemK/MazF family toxin, partial [Heyndrickxia sporothermodurans]|nr:type II toxin-antitoxin system PemK/MazF family toxin [Heyndrickxia sporothermodurans]MED3782712.1 type II toxin-antitoxin system PemK/MazF family toxin [Heyndrickxia sporothermodurans]
KIRGLIRSKAQRYLEWLKTKLFLDGIAYRAKKRVVKRGEVYKCNLGYGVGSEESKERPCVILQRDDANSTSPNVIVAPITHTSSTLPVVIPISDKFDGDGNLILDGNVLLGNIVCVSKSRLGEYISSLSKDEMKRVDEAIAIALDVKHYYVTINNMLDDKLVYIEKLKSKINTLESELSEKERKIEELSILGS